MPKVNRDQLATINISLPDKEEQTKIVEIINAQIQILEGLHQMKAKAQKKCFSNLGRCLGIRICVEMEEVTEVKFIITKMIN